MKRFIFGALALTMLSSYVMGKDNVSNEAGTKVRNNLVPKKDIDFLYELVIGGDYKFYKNSSSFAYGKSLSFLKRSWFWIDDLYEIKESNGTTIALEQSNVRRYRLEAIKEDLNISSNDTLTIIEEAYRKKLNYEDWDSDRIRFMTTVNYIEDLKDVVPSIGIMAFPAYKKYIPGNFDILRRTAIYASIGDSDKSKDKVYSAGLNFEIHKGMGINVGQSIYTIDDNRENTITFGVTLSSDLFKTFWIK